MLVVHNKKRKMMLRTILSVTFLFTGLLRLAAATEYFTDIRKEAALVQRGSDEDYLLGDQLMDEIRKLSATRQSPLPRPFLIVETVFFRSGKLWYTEKHWRDRQLIANRKFWDKSFFVLSNYLESFRIMQDSGVDAVNFFIDNVIRERLYDAAELGKLDPEQFSIIPTLSPNVHVETGAPILQHGKLPGEAHMKRAVSSPYAMKFQGRPLFFGYSSDRRTPEEIEIFIRNIEEAGGGRIAFITDIDGNGVKSWPSLDFAVRKRVRATDILRHFDHLRRHLAVSDGIEYGYYLGKQDRNLFYDYYDQILLPLFSAACASEPFNGQKILACKIVQGYTNCNGSQTLDSDGTKTLRGFLELCRKHKVDLLCGFEWDEHNENTNLEPTVAKPMANARILRYWMDQVKGIAPSPRDGDDLSRPNLIVSSNRQLCCGQEYEIELLNVPDGVQESYTVEVEVVDNLGKVVYRSPLLSFDASVLQDRTLRIPTENLPYSLSLQPQLRVNYLGKTELITGLPPTAVRGTVSIDYTWFSVPLRNLLKPEAAHVEFAEKGSVRPGCRKVEAQVDVKFSESLNALEIVQNSQDLYSYDHANEFRQRDPSARLFRLSFRIINGYLKHEYRIECPGAQTFKTERLNEPAKIIPLGSTETATEGRLCHDELILIPADQVPEAELTVQGKRLSGPDAGTPYEWKVKLAEVEKVGVTCNVFPDTFAIALEAFPKPLRLPLELNLNQVQFTAPLIVEQPDAMLAVRAISNSGKVWWSAGYALPASGAMMEVQSCSDLRGRLRFELPESRIPNFTYDFNSPGNGTVLPSPYGRDYYAHAGGFLSLATGFEGLIHGFTVPIRYQAPGEPPEWLCLPQGARALKFNGKTSQGLFFPNTFVPPRNGFTISFEIEPAEIQRRQILFEQIGAANYLNGFRINIVNGMLELEYRSHVPYDPKAALFYEEKINTSLPLAIGERQTITLRYDGETAVLGVNGKEESCQLKGIPYWLTISAFGGRGEQRFAGILYKVSTCHSAGTRATK